MSDAELIPLDLMLGDCDFLSIEERADFVGN